MCGHHLEVWTDVKSWRLLISLKAAVVLVIEMMGQLLSFSLVVNEVLVQMVVGFTDELRQNQLDYKFRSDLIQTLLGIW